MTFTNRPKPSNRVTCPKCNGEGWYINVVSAVIADIILEKEFDIDCELCETLGYIQSRNDNERIRLVKIH